MGKEIIAGSKITFNDEFKQKIIDAPERDWLFYIKDKVFEVKEVKDDAVSIVGIHVLGFQPLSIFNKL